MLSNLATLLAAQEEAEHGAEHEPSGLDLILPATPELIGGALAFLVVLFVLNKFAFPKIREAIEARERQIRESLEQAETTKAEAEKEAQQYRAQLGDARAEANQIIEQARQQAEQVRRDIIARAEKEAEAIVARAEEQLTVERQRTMQELRGTLADLSIELAEKVVGRSLDEASQRQFIDGYIRDVEAMSGNGGRG